LKATTIPALELKLHLQNEYTKNTWEQPVCVFEFPGHFANIPAVIAPPCIVMEKSTTTTISSTVSHRQHQH